MTGPGLTRGSHHGGNGPDGRCSPQKHLKISCFSLNSKIFLPPNFFFRRNLSFFFSKFIFKNGFRRFSWGKFFTDASQIIERFDRVWLSESNTLFSKQQWLRLWIKTGKKLVLLPSKTKIYFFENSQLKHQKRHRQISWLVFLKNEKIFLLKFLVYTSKNAPPNFFDYYIQKSKTCFVENQRKNRLQEIIVYMIEFFWNLAVPRLMYLLDIAKIRGMIFLKQKIKDMLFFGLLYFSSVDVNKVMFGMKNAQAYIELIKIINFRKFPTITLENSFFGLLDPMFWIPNRADCPLRNNRGHKSLFILFY